MEHVARRIKVQWLARRLQHCRHLSSQIPVHISSIEPRTHSHSDRGRTELSLVNELRKILGIDILLSRLPWKNPPTPQTINLGFPISKIVVAGYPQLHWDSERVHHSECKTDESIDSTCYDTNVLSVSNGTGICAYSQVAERDEIFDWLTDVHESPMNECSSFYSLNTSAGGNGRVLSAVDDMWHREVTNLAAQNEDDIVLRDIDDYKVCVDGSVLDAPRDQGPYRSTVLKSSLEPVDPCDLDTILKSDLNATIKNRDLSGLCNAVPDNFNILQCSATPGVGGSKKEQDPNTATKEQLLEVKKYLIDTLPEFFKSHIHYSRYHKEVIFENYFFKKPVITRTITAYAVNLMKIRSLANLRYANIFVRLYGITVHEEECEVRVRWHLDALSHWRIFMFWKFLPHNYARNRTTGAIPYDGISTFTIGADGLIHKHRVDRMMKDENLSEVKKDAMAPAVASILLALLPGAPGLH